MSQRIAFVEETLAVQQRSVWLSAVQRVVVKGFRDLDTAATHHYLPDVDTIARLQQYAVSLPVLTTLDLRG